MTIDPKHIARLEQRLRDVETELIELKKVTAAAWQAARGALGVDDGVYEMEEGETLADLIEALAGELDVEHERAEKAESRVRIAIEGLRQMRQELDAELAR